MQEELLALREQVEDLQTQVDFLMLELESIAEFVSERKKQQIGTPLDDASRDVVIRAIKTNTSGRFIELGLPTELTISGGVITPSGSYHTVDTQSDAATDDLDTISVNGINNGTLLVLRPASASRTVVVKDGTGNLRTAGDFSMDNSTDTITLVKDADVWREVSRSDNDS